MGQRLWENALSCRARTRRGQADTCALTSGVSTGGGSRLLICGCLGRCSTRAGRWAAQRATTGSCGTAAPSLPGYTVCLYRPQIQIHPRVMEPQRRYCPRPCELLLQHLWEPDCT